jgi:DNA polymerase-3 subunit epsilon
MVLFFDTETTGLPKDWNAPVSDTNNWPRLVQLAWLEFDNEGNPINNGNHIIKPEGYIIPAEATDIHGITNEKANKTGEKLHDVLHDFSQRIKDADYIVAHNMDFDEKILGAELVRSGISSSLFSKNRICTMKTTVNYCAIPGNYGYKWPKLSELHYKIFGVGFEEAHDASIDVKATARCFWELKKQKVLYSNIGTISLLTGQTIEHTSQSISNKVEYAGFWLRLGAGIIDLIIANMIGAIIFLLFLGVPNDAKSSEASANAMGMLCGWLYYALMESSSSCATVGKLLFGIKVTDEHGNKIGFGKATGRFFGKFLSLLILYIGFLMIGFTKRKQGLHDQLARTLVVKN